MRALWPIERAVLEATAQDFPASAKALRLQMSTARVTDFENTGAGFFSTVAVSATAPPLLEKGPLDGAYGSVAALEAGMSFVIFLEDGRLSLIEGYTNGPTSTVDIDFGAVSFNLKPWSAPTE